MGIHLNPDHDPSNFGDEDPKYPICPGCGKRHKPEVDLAAMNILDLVKAASQMLNHVEDDQAIATMIGSFVGVFAESIEDKTWAKVLAVKVKPCGGEGCDCHEHTERIIRELHRLKEISVANEDLHKDKEDKEPK